MNDPKKTVTVAAQLINIEAAVMQCRAAILLEDIDVFLTRYSEMQQMVINLNGDLNSKLESNAEYFLAADANETKNND